MEYRELRELVHLRHELRRFAQTPVNTTVQREEVYAVMDQMRALAAQDPAERASVGSELERWRMRLSLDT